MCIDVSVLCGLIYLLSQQTVNYLCGTSPSIRVVFSDLTQGTWRKIKGYVPKRVKWDGRTRGVRIYGGPRGHSQGSFGPFLVATDVSGKRTDVETILMDVGDEH